jgi:toxin ParE1/3/4
MSARRRAIAFAPEAWADYDNIMLYGTLTWGEAQTDLYQEALDTAIDRLSEFPELGQQRHDLCSGCRLLPVERHMVIYRLARNIIEIIRILHERVDPGRHLPR